MLYHRHRSCSWIKTFAVISRDIIVIVLEQNFCCLFMRYIVLFLNQDFWSTVFLWDIIGLVLESRLLQSFHDKSSFLFLNQDFRSLFMRYHSSCSYPVHIFRHRRALFFVAKNLDFSHCVSLSFFEWLTPHACYYRQASAWHRRRPILYRGKVGSHWGRGTVVDTMSTTAVERGSL